jgi:hypothetical protein
MSDIIVTPAQTSQVRSPVPKKSEREIRFSRDFSTFQVRLTQDKIGKKKLSNRLTIIVPDERSESVIKMTLREARALRKFLNDNLKD